MNIVSITLMIGSGMPIVYIIGALAFVILFIVEKYMIAKIYQKPPNFGKEISKETVEQLQSYCLLLAFPLGFWLFSNK